MRHPWPYHYYVDVNNSSLNKHAKLKPYLLSMFSDCPHEKFLDGPRSSSLKTKSEAKLVEIPQHEVCSFAQKGNEWGMQGTAHGNVQLWMMQQDEKTIGVEIPIWFDEDELSQYDLVLDKKGPLSGHIDVLRVEDGKIWVWDYKPKAAKEKFADTQVLMYAAMLSHRTGISLENFMCGYFDEHTSYVFKPKKEFLKKLQ